ncbi:MAG: hypothetical protein AAB649_07590 [Patescibacteria group bacterium]
MILQININNSWGASRVFFELFNTDVRKVANYGFPICLGISAVGLSSMMRPLNFPLGYGGVLDELEAGRKLKCKMIRRDRCLSKLHDMWIIQKDDSGNEQRILMEEINDDTIINLDKETRMVLTMNGNCELEMFLEEVKS